MKIFCSRRALGVACGLGFVAALAGCTDVDDSLGRGMIPPSQQMELRIDTLSAFDAYIATNDSIPASGQGKFLIGNYEDPVFGRVRATAMTDYYPMVTWNDGEYYGNRPVVDSIFLNILINDIYGDPSVEQTFNIYAMRDSMKRDSIYKVGTPLEDKADMNAPLFSFKLSDNIPRGAMTPVKLEPTSAGQALMDRLAAVSTDTYKDPWPAFRKAFNGLYIAPDPGSPTDAAVYDIELRNSLAGLLLWYHNYKEDEPSVVDTVTYAAYDFSDTGWYTDGRMVNVNIMSLEHDYPVEIADNLNDTLPGDLPLDKVYVQSMGGVLTYLKVSQEVKEWLSDMEEEDNSGIVIQQARLVVGIDGPVAETLDVAPTRLGMYYFFGSGEPISDYNYLVENSSYSSTSIPYGGYLFRTKGYYQMIVTQWFTRLMLNGGNTPQRIWLAPEINTRASKYSQVALSGDMKLVVTYTAID